MGGQCLEKFRARQHPQPRYARKDPPRHDFVRELRRHYKADAGDGDGETSPPPGRTATYGRQWPRVARVMQRTRICNALTSHCRFFYYRHRPTVESPRVKGGSSPHIESGYASASNCNHVHDCRERCGVPDTYIDVLPAHDREFAAAAIGVRIDDQVQCIPLSDKHIAPVSENKR